MAKKRKTSLDYFAGSASEDENKYHRSVSEDDIEQSHGDSDDELVGSGDELEHSDEEESGRTGMVSRKRGNKKMKYDDINSEEERDESEEEEEEEEEEEDQQAAVVKPISQEELQKSLEKLKKTGVVYLSRIPPYMKPIKMKQILSRFGEVNRIFLAPEDSKTYSRRVKYGGNKKKKYTEGWAEYSKKRDAKLAAHTLNGNIIGGRKGSYYHDDILNVKYLPKFKWNNLTEQIALENQARQEKMRAEISQATRENKLFIENVERQKMVSKIQEKRAQAGIPAETDIRREFTQRTVTSARANDKNNKTKTSSKVSNVLSRVF